MNYQMHLWRKIGNDIEGLLEICQKNSRSPSPKETKICTWQPVAIL